MKTLMLDGVEFVKASEAAKAHGYTSDYIGQLCRGGKIQAQLVGRSWYVNLDSLNEHRRGRYRSNQKKTSQIVKEDITQAHKEVAKPHYYDRLVENTDINYEADEQELIPDLKKVTVESDGGSLHPIEQELRVMEAEEEPSEYYLETEYSQKPSRGRLDIVDEDRSEAKPQEVRAPSLTKKIKKPVKKKLARTTGIKGCTNESITPDRLTPTKKTTVSPKSPATEPKTASSRPQPSPFVEMVAPVSLSLLAGLAVAGLLVGFSWQFEANSVGETSGYTLSLSSVIQAITK